MPALDRKLQLRILRNSGPESAVLPTWTVKSDSSGTNGVQSHFHPVRLAAPMTQQGEIMKIHLKSFRVSSPGSINLKKWPTRIDPVFASKADYDHILAAHVASLSALQKVHYAANTHAVLVIFQAMDAAGKDGAIRHVMSGVNPQGCQVVSFKQPSATELEHDFLWRTTCHLPERGQIGIFNRSYYEDVLIVRVHRDKLQAEGLPDPDHHDGKLWKDRYRSINDFERHLHANGTRIVKIFLHLSKDEQRTRFIARIDDPDKNWKFSPADIAERAFWKHYRTAYEDCIGATSSPDAPWYIVPADDKNNARLIVSQIVVDALQGLDANYPKADAARVAQLQSIRAELAAEP
jgi:PPK2 family polyphosphate:nucleotide phosphotransferase